MDLREKLIEFLTGYSLDTTPDVEYVAEELIKKGVTVQECGEWTIVEDDWNEETIYQCSVCKEEFVTLDGTPSENLWNYCPACGADMREPPKGE